MIEGFHSLQYCWLSFRAPLCARRDRISVRCKIMQAAYPDVAQVPQCAWSSGRQSFALCILLSRSCWYSTFLSSFVACSWQKLSFNLLPFQIFSEPTPRTLQQRGVYLGWGELLELSKDWSEIFFLLLGQQTLIHFFTSSSPGSSFRIWMVWMLWSKSFTKYFWLKTFNEKYRFWYICILPRVPVSCANPRPPAINLNKLRKAWCAAIAWN